MKAARKKPTVYLDTTILSSYWYEGSDILALGRRITPREWWNKERSYFALRVSSVTEDELEAGSFPHQEDALSLVQRLRFLPMIVKVREFAKELMHQHVVPNSKPGNALQMAIAAVHHVGYLLTWNYAHLANPIAQMQLETAC